LQQVVDADLLCGLPMRSSHFARATVPVVVIDAVTRLLISFASPSWWSAAYCGPKERVSQDRPESEILGAHSRRFSAALARSAALAEPHGNPQRARPFLR
jgi:hypothetical protein